MRPRSVPNSLHRAWKDLPGRLTGLTRLSLAAAVATSVALPSQPVFADGINVVRDAETEALIQDYAAPIFKAAGVGGGKIQIFLVQDDRFNAFVADASRMFVNTGAIMTTETPNEMIGVLAHEAAHLAHGDLAGIRQQIASSSTAVLIGALLGVGAAIAGTAAGAPSLGQIGSGIMAGSMQAGQRSILAYQRAQEAAADRSAVDYLNATGQSGEGMVAVLRRLANQDLLSARDADPYVQSHLLPADRLSTVEALVSQSKYAGRKDPPELQHRHDLVRAKLAGFTLTPQQVGRRYPPSDTSLPARYARAIAAYRAGALKPALQQMDELIQSEPDNPYFRELKGQALLESGHPADAIDPLDKAVSLAPRSGLLRILYGQALVATEKKANVELAIKNLTVGLQSDPDVPIGWRTLARGYALTDNIPMAEFATAEGLFADGNFKEAQIHATRAQERLKNGSPAWLRAGDIIAHKPPSSR